MAKIDNILANLNIEQFKRDYYDDTRPASEIAKKYGVNIGELSRLPRALGWKTRREAGCIWKTGLTRSKKRKPPPWAVGCNSGCRFWKDCNQIPMPVPLPCEVYVFPFEYYESDPDGGEYYRSPLMAMVKQ